MTSLDHEHAWILYGVGSTETAGGVSWRDHAECWCGAIMDRRELEPVAPLVVSTEPQDDANAPR